MGGRKRIFIIALLSRRWKEGKKTRAAWLISCNRREVILLRDDVRKMPEILSFLRKRKILCSSFICTKEGSS